MANCSGEELRFGADAIAYRNARVSALEVEANRGRCPLSVHPIALVAATPASHRPRSALIKAKPECDNLNRGVRRRGQGKGCRGLILRSATFRSAVAGARVGTLQQIIPAAAALVVAGSVGVAVLHVRAFFIRMSPTLHWPDRPRRRRPSRLEALRRNRHRPEFPCGNDAGRAAGSVSPLASVEAVSAPFPLPSLDAFPPEPTAGAPAELVPLPPAHDVPEIGESAPLPPPRPPEFGAPAAPEHHFAQPNVAAVRPTAPVDNRNFFQKLFGLGLPPAPGIGVQARRRVGARRGCAPSRFLVGARGRQRGAGSPKLGQGADRRVPAAVRRVRARREL